MNRIADFAFLGTIAALFFFLGGCSPLVTGADEHEEEHLEHHVPAHRPAGFTEAVDQIQERYQRMRGKLPSGARPSEEELKEFMDILGWVPEIAADSDMRRKHWEQADSLSAQLAEAFEKWRVADFQGQTSLTETIEAFIGQLKNLCGTEMPAE